MHVGDTIFIFCLALIIFGPKKLPELGKGIGEGIRGFKSALNDRADAADATQPADKQGQA